MHIRLRGELVEAPATKTDEYVFGFWAQRFHRAGNPTEWDQDVQEVAAGVRDAWVTHCATKSLYSSAVNMKAAQVYHMGTNNRTLDLGEALFDDDNTWNGTAAGGLPWEAAVVVTLWGYTPGAFAPNKARKRNRFYLPPMATSVMTTYSGKITDDARGTLTTEIAGFLNEVQGLNIGLGGPGNDPDYVNLVCLSKGDTAPGGGASPRDPSVTNLLTMGIGNVVDSQRRRRNKQIEVYSSADIDHAD